MNGREAKVAECAPHRGHLVAHQRTPVSSPGPKSRGEVLRRFVSLHNGFGWSAYTRGHGPLTALEQALASVCPPTWQAITTAYKKAMIRDADRRRLGAHLTRRPHETVPFSEAINHLKPKQREPRSARVLDGWIVQAQKPIGGQISSGGRLG